MGHAMFLGVKGAKEILKVLIKNLDLELSLSEIETEIKELEQGLKKAGEIIQMKSQGRPSDVNYIG
jgi:proteasome assembly chaperone (PAC2) family protein